MSIGGSGSSVKVYTATQPSYTFTGILAGSSQNLNSPNTSYPELSGASAIFLPYVSDANNTEYMISRDFYEMTTNGSIIHLRLMVPNSTVSVIIQEWNSASRPKCTFYIGMNTSGELYSYFSLTKANGNEIGSQYAPYMQSFLVIAFF